jgi:hypothetical protein
VPQEWKPFGSTDSIRGILDKLLARVNARLSTAPGVPGLQLRWQFVDLITSDFDNRLDDEVQKLSTGTCLLIIDPLSLGVQDHPQRFGKLLPCFENKSATIVSLTSFQAHQPFVALRKLVRDSAQPLMYGYYEPLPPRPPLGRCAVNLVDPDDVGRMLLAAAAELSNRAVLTTPSAMIRHGER